MKIIKWFAELSLPLKLVVGSVVGAIAGPGWIAFLSEYATYMYAISLGVRPPVEGIPYLSATAALASLVLAIVASIIFLITRFLFAVIGGQVVAFVYEIAKAFDEGIQEYRRRGGRFLSNLKVSESLEMIRGLSLVHVVGIVLGLSLALFIFFGWFDEDGEAQEGKAMAFVLSLYFSVAILSLWSRWFSWVVGVVAAAAFYVVSWQVFLDFEYHEKYLGVIGYGGGVPVHVDFDAGGSQDFDLFLRTSTSLIGKVAKQDDVIEIPVDKIRRIVYLNVSEGD